MSLRRIALVTESFYPATDGTTTTVKAVADRLIDTGHELLIVAPGPGLATYRGHRVARVRPLDKPGRQVKESLADFAPDLVHVTSPGTLGRKALKHSVRLDLPTLTVQQSPVPELTDEYWRRKVAARSDLVLSTCSWMSGRLAELGVSGAPVWSPGVDALAFTPSLRDRWLHDKWSRARARGGPLTVVGYVGSLHKRHGVRDLIEPAQVPGVRLVVVGEGPQREWLAERLPRTKFTGALGTGDLATAIASMDVLVHPGQFETCCHALREAAASGVPVVAPDRGGACDVVVHEETGLLTDPDESGSLRQGVARLVGDPALRSQWGDAARERAKQRSWDQAVDELIATHYPATIGAHRDSSTSALDPMLIG